MASTLTFLFVICAALLFGIFFLVFKIVWLILDKKQNFWPLTLAGVGTALVMCLLTILVYQSYQRFIRPLQPVINAAAKHNSPVYGPHAYADNRFPFAITLHDGIVLSDWLDFDSATQIKVGMDVNPIRQGKPSNPQDLRGTLIARKAGKQYPYAMDFFEKQLLPALQNDSNMRDMVKLSAGPFPISVGPYATAAYATATLHSDKVPQPIPAILLVVVDEDTTYYVGGLGGGPVENTVTSFKLLN
ncbi:MAG: hypothetical protein J6U96_04390 [Elusimicrobiaceae bacterium]|nr:hypothetical protein [Elusimicrobiaceae bacterium]